MELTPEEIAWVRCLVGGIHYLGTGFRWAPSVELVPTDPDPADC